MRGRSRSHVMAVISVTLSVILAGEPVVSAVPVNGAAFSSELQVRTLISSPVPLNRVKTELGVILNILKRGLFVPRQDLNARLDEWYARCPGMRRLIDIYSDPEISGDDVSFGFTLKEAGTDPGPYRVSCVLEAAEGGVLINNVRIAPYENTSSGDLPGYRDAYAGEGTAEHPRVQLYSLEGASDGTRLSRISPDAVEGDGAGRPGGDDNKGTAPFNSFGAPAGLLAFFSDGSADFFYICCAVAFAAAVFFTFSVVSALKKIYGRAGPVRLDLNTAGEREIRDHLERIWPSDRKARKEAVRRIIKIRRRNPLTDIDQLEGIPAELKGSLRETCSFGDEAPGGTARFPRKIPVILSGVIGAAALTGVLLSGGTERSDKEASQRPALNSGREKQHHVRNRFFVVFTAHGEEKDFSMIRDDLDHVLEVSPPDPARKGQPHLVIIHESILVLESVKQFLPPRTAKKNIFTLVYDEEFKADLRRAYEETVRHDEDYLREQDELTYSEREHLLVRYLSQPGHSGFTRAYYSWAASSGARQRAAPLGFEEWYNAMRAQLDNSYNLCLFEGDAEGFFDRFSYFAYHYLYLLKRTRDRAVVEQVEQVRKRFPGTNVVYPVGFSHSTNRRIFEKAGGCEFLGGKSAGIAEGFSRRLTQRYGEPGFRGSPAEKDLLALLYFETALTNIAGPGLSAADVTNMLESRFKALEKKGISPANVLFAVSHALESEDVPQTDLLKTKVRFPFVARELYRGGGISEDVYRRLKIPAGRGGVDPDAEDPREKEDGPHGSLPASPGESAVRETIAAGRVVQNAFGHLPSDILDDNPVDIILDLSLADNTRAEEIARTWAHLI
ncbi:MAG: hypothetical protein GF392_00535, partial [Candidatus Omnitrophica bacterium]|nr:hypothetical protein [Candidatus Omnitrophota bacterium]